MSNNHWTTLLAAAFCFWSAYAECVKKKELNEIKQHGQLLTAVVTKKPADCRSGYRSQNAVSIALPNGVPLSLNISYERCKRLNERDAIEVLYLEKYQHAICYIPGSNSRTPSPYTIEILILLLGLFFSWLYLRDALKNRKA